METCMRVLYKQTHAYIRTRTHDLSLVLWGSEEAWAEIYKFVINNAPTLWDTEDTISTAMLGIDLSWRTA